MSSGQRVAETVDFTENNKKITSSLYKQVKSFVICYEYMFI